MEYITLQNNTKKAQNGNLHIKNTGVPKLQREGDKSIMDEFTKILKISKQKLKATKIC